MQFLVVYNILSKMTHIVGITKETLVKGLVRLIKDKVWKLHRLSESMISNRGPQFVADLTKELDQILGIETRLLTVFYSQTDRQMERIIWWLQISQSVIT